MLKEQAESLCLLLNTGFVWLAGRMFHAMQAIGGEPAAPCLPPPLKNRALLLAWRGLVMRRGGAGRRKVGGERG